MKYLEDYNCNCSLTYSLDDDLYSKCVKKNKNEVSLNCTKDFIVSFQQANMYKTCSKYCPLECDIMSYDILHYSQMIHANGLIKSDKFKYKQFNTYENFSKSFLSVNIFYDNLQYTLISQKPKTEMFNFISNIGGLLGVFLGISFLSFIEIFETFFEIMFILFKK